MGGTPYADLVGEGEEGLVGRIFAAITQGWRQPQPPNCPDQLSPSPSNQSMRMWVKVGFAGTR